MNWRRDSSVHIEKLIGRQQHAREAAERLFVALIRGHIGLSQQFAGSPKPGLILRKFYSRWRAAPRDLLGVTETADIVASRCQESAREKFRLFVHELIVQREQCLLRHN